MQGLPIHRARERDVIRGGKAADPRSSGKYDLISTVPSTIGVDDHATVGGLNARYPLHPVNASAVARGQFQLSGDGCLGPDEASSGSVVTAVSFTDVELRKAGAHFI